MTTDNAPILRGRTQVAIPAPESREHLDVAMQKATAIARAGDMLPKSYRGQPGAIVLAMDWADRHGLSIMDAIHGVAWVQGRPVIDASLQRALAQAAGYRIIVEDVSTEAASVSVSSAEGELIGRATYTIEEAKVAGLAGKDNWRKNPADMLVARASTRAIKWFCPGVLIGGALSPEDVEQTDAIATLTPTASADYDAPAPEPEPEVIEAEVVSAPFTPAEAAAAAGPPSARTMPDTDPDDRILPGTKGEVRAAFETAKAAEKFQALTDAIQAEGMSLVIGKLTEAEAQRVLTIAGEL